MFSDNCLNKNADSLAVYLEPENDVEQMNLSYMDIHTTTDQLEWGNLNPQIYYKSIPAIKELNETTATNYPAVSDQQQRTKKEMWNYIQ